MKVFNHVDFDEWQEIADKCEYATFFHTPTWSKVFTETYPEMEIATKKFVFDDGARVILPLIKTKAIRGLFSSYISNVAGVYGGWISEEKLSEQKIKEMMKWINKHLKNLIWRINPFDISLEKTLKGFEITNMKKDFTQYLDLRDGFENIWKKYSKGHRYNINKAEKMGVYAEVAKTIEDFKEYYNIYQDSLKRWGNSATSRYNFNLFENIYNQKSKNTKLWLALVDDKIISGALVFYCNKHVVWWHGATLSDFFNYYPSNFLQNVIIEDACKKGYWYYDFNPSGGHKGVVKFKKGFGTKRMKSIIIYKSSFAYKIISRVYKYVKNNSN